MNYRIIIVLMLVIPALVYFGVGFANQGGSYDVGSGLRFFLPNYLFFSFPHFVCLIINYFGKLRRAAGLGGLIAANVTLIVMALLFVTAIDNSNALGWMYYPYVQLIVIPIGYAVGFKLRT